VVLVTDSILAAGLGEGKLEFAESMITVKDGAAVFENGVLAGSTITMADGIGNMVKKLGFSLEDTIKWLQQILPTYKHFDRKGSLSEGKDADIVILDRSLNIHENNNTGNYGLLYISIPSE